MLHWWQKPSLSDGVVDLLEIDPGPADERLKFGEEHCFVIMPHGKRKEAGRIGIRLGESEPIFYFGHIGYHVDPPWRGNHFAARACKLVLPYARLAGKRSLVITADPDNWPSRKTCERIGCQLESIVPVPKYMQQRWQISAVKCRYIWMFEE